MAITVSLLLLIEELIMTKIVYNECYGGFGLSDEAVMLYAKLKGITLYKHEDTFCDMYTTVPEEEWNKLSTREQNDTFFSVRDIERHDEILVQVVEKLKGKGDGMFASLTIEELPKGTLYRICEYDGYEYIETSDSIAWKVA